MTLYTLDDLTNLLRCLRDPDHGCPWDRQQNYQSIVPFTLEEAYEVAHAVEHGSFDELKGELGDLLFQVVFYSQLAQEDDRFDLSDVVDGVVRKMLNRHPHVFPDATFESFGRADCTEKSTINLNWEDKKEQERVDHGQLDLFDDVPREMLALRRATKIQKRAARIGYDWPGVDGVFRKVLEEFGELIEARGDSARECEEFGDLLFTIVSLARHLGIDSEQALRLATHKFEARILRLLQDADEQSITLSIATESVKNELWIRAKRSE